MRNGRTVVYWVATVWLALGMGATGVQQLMHLPLDQVLAPPGVFGATQLGFPAYFLTLIGIWKLLAVPALLVPRFPVVKEWAYAGIFFLLTGALFAHLATGHSAAELFPASLLLVMEVLSWTLRPAHLKPATTPLHA